MKGTKSDANAIVYELDAFGSDSALLAAWRDHPKADRDVLFFLGNDGSLLVGNEDFGYTLNRDTSQRTKKSE